MEIITREVIKIPRRNICKVCIKEFTKPHNPSRVYKYCSIKCMSLDSDKAEQTSKSLQGNVVWNKNKKGVQSAWNKGMTGEKSHLWIKNRTLLKDDSRERGGQLSIEWSRQVKLRDGKCLIGNENCNGRLESHHILSWVSCPKLRYEITNGITLCKFHHPRKKKDEIRLIPYLQGLLEAYYGS